MQLINAVYLPFISSQSFVKIHLSLCIDYCNKALKSISVV